MENEREAVNYPEGLALPFSFGNVGLGVAPDQVRIPDEKIHCGILALTLDLRGLETALQREPVCRPVTPENTTWRGENRTQIDTETGRI